MLARIIERERPAILMAQRLARLDPDIRLALSETWWSALRVGMMLARDNEASIPEDPFGLRGMERPLQQPPPF